jgi:hypothetical protein
MCVGKVKAYSKVEHLKGASLRQALVLPTNMRLGKNTLAYYKHL